MKRESAIITTFIIEKPKQVKHFQIKIPREAENIIGVEMGVNWKEGFNADMPGPPPTAIWTLPMMLRRNLNMGEMKLQSYEKANIFYTGELSINRNIDNADFTSGFFDPKVYTHQTQAHEVNVKVNGNTTVIQGVYRDKLSESIESLYKYKVTLCVWYASKEK